MLVTQAMTIKTRQVLVCVVFSFPLWCKSGKRRRGVPRHQAKVAILVQRDQDQQDGKTEVTMEPKTASPPEPFAGEDHFCQGQLVLVVPFQNWLSLLTPFPLNIWGEDQGLYK